MAKEDKKAITKKSQDQSQWYTDVVLRSKMADYSPVRGCMVIRPYGYAIWESIQADLDQRIKAAGVQNAYFPLFIPYSFLEREADHVEGFAPEVAVVTIAGNKELEEKLVVRPTSETIIYDKFKDWIQSYRDLPLKVNQWANVVRWEKRTTPFLRTTEFLWQEGHTAHATKEDAAIEVTRALDMYHEMVKNHLAMYTIRGYKTEAEKFPGGEYTTTIEALMEDNKALQSGTSHLLSQGFAESFGVKFQDENGEEQVIWPTSWGLSTRIIGGLILSHGDDKGLVLPPKVAPVQVITIPIYKSDNEEVVRGFINQVEQRLNQFRSETDWSDNSPGFKFSEAELRGVPIRLEVGPRDVESNSVTAVIRHSGEKVQIAIENLETEIKELLDHIQVNMWEKSRQRTLENTHKVTTQSEFYELTESGEPVGFVKAFFCGDPELEAQIKEKTKFTTRCIPFDTFDQEGECIFTGKTGKKTLFARAY